MTESDQLSDTNKVRLGEDLENLAMWASRWAVELQKDAPEEPSALIDCLVDEAVKLRALIPEPELLRRLANYADSRRFNPNYEHASSDCQTVSDLAQRVTDHLSQKERL